MQNLHLELCTLVYGCCHCTLENLGKRFRNCYSDTVLNYYRKVQCLISPSVWKQGQGLTHVRQVLCHSVTAPSPFSKYSSETHSSYNAQFGLQFPTYHSCFWVAGSQICATNPSMLPHFLRLLFSIRNGKKKKDFCSLLIVSEWRWVGHSVLLQLAFIFNLVATIRHFKFYYVSRCIFICTCWSGCWGRPGRLSDPSELESPAVLSRSTWVLIILELLSSARASSMSIKYS